MEGKAENYYVWKMDIWCYLLLRRENTLVTKNDSEQECLKNAYILAVSESLENSSSTEPFLIFFF